MGSTWSKKQINVSCFSAKSGSPRRKKNVAEPSQDLKTFTNNVTKNSRSDRNADDSESEEIQNKTKRDAEQKNRNDGSNAMKKFKGRLFTATAYIVRMKSINRKKVWSNKTLQFLTLSIVIAILYLIRSYRMMQS